MILFRRILYIRLVRYVSCSSIILEARNHLLHPKQLFYASIVKFEFARTIQLVDLSICISSLDNKGRLIEPTYNPQTIK